MIRTDEDIAPGNSSVNVLTGKVGVYFESNAKGPTNGWASYVNMNDTKIKDHDNQMYAAGFMVAHELVHQTLGISSYYSGRRYMPYDHDNQLVNLMNRGALITIPATPSAKNALHDVERIPESFRQNLDPFYLTPSSRIR